MWTITHVISNGRYNMAVVPEHPKADDKGYVRNTHVVMENSIGRLLNPNEVVHHKNNDSKDDRLENLELLTRGEHTHIHRELPAMLDMVCTSCGKSFKLRKRWVEWRSNAGQQNFYCCRRCQWDSLKNIVGVA